MTPNAITRDLQLFPRLRIRVSTKLPTPGWSPAFPICLERARRMSARSVNSILTATYWEIGRRIVEFEQGGKARAEYGEALLKTSGRRPDGQAWTRVLGPSLPRNADVLSGRGRFAQQRRANSRPTCDTCPGRRGGGTGDLLNTVEQIWTCRRS